MTLRAGAGISMANTSLDITDVKRKKSENACVTSILIQLLQLSKDFIYSWKLHMCFLFQFIQVEVLKFLIKALYLLYHNTYRIFPYVSRDILYRDKSVSSQP